MEEAHTRESRGVDSEDAASWRMKDRWGRSQKSKIAYMIRRQANTVIVPQHKQTAGGSSPGGDARSFFKALKYVKGQTLLLETPSIRA